MENMRVRGTMAGERNEVIGNEKEDGRPHGDHLEKVLQETGEKEGADSFISDKES